MTADQFRVYPRAAGGAICCATKSRPREKIAADVAPEFEVVEELGAVYGKDEKKDEIILCRHWLLREVAP